MFTSDEKRTLRAALGDTLLTAFIAFFGAVYELFSHEVYSYWMLYSFAIPLLGGVLPMLCLALRRRHPTALSVMLWHFGMITLTVGSVMQGVVAIYGSTNRLIRVYPIAGGVFLLAGAMAFLLGKKGDRNAECEMRNVE